MTTAQRLKARATAGFMPSPAEPLAYQRLPTRAQHRIATSDVWVPRRAGNPARGPSRETAAGPKAGCRSPASVHETT